MGFGTAGSVVRWKLGKKNALVCLDNATSKTQINTQGHSEGIQAMLIDKD